MGEKSNKNVKFHTLERSTEESVSTFQSVVKAEQLNGGPQEKRPLSENNPPARRSNQEQGTDKAIKRLRGAEIQPIALSVETRAYACEKPPTEKGVIRTGKKVYRPQLPSNYKETELPEDLNYGMEWVLRDY